jgi:hypothetical protein
LSFQVIGQILPGAIGAGGVGLVPVVRVMDVFLPTSGHDGDFVCALGSQVGRPGQTKDFNIEFFIHFSQVSLQHLRDDLAQGIAGVVQHLDAETHFPNVIRVLASRDAVFIDIRQLELLGAFFKIKGVVRCLWVKSGHTGQ